MANAQLGETYPISVKLQSGSTEFKFDSSQITVDASTSKITVYNSRGGQVASETGTLKVDPDQLIITYQWNTTDYAPQEYYTFKFEIHFTYTPTSASSTSTPVTSVLTAKVVKALQGDVFTTGVISNI